MPCIVTQVAPAPRDAQFRAFAACRVALSTLALPATICRRDDVRFPPSLLTTVEAILDSFRVFGSVSAPFLATLKRRIGHIEPTAAYLPTPRALISAVLSELPTYPTEGVRMNTLGAIWWNWTGRRRLARHRG